MPEPADSDGRYILIGILVAALLIILYPWILAVMLGLVVGFLLIQVSVYPGGTKPRKDDEELQEQRPR